MVYVIKRVHKYICIMNIVKTSILISCILSTLTCSAKKYQIKVLNTPSITIDKKEAKIGDWFDDESVIVWSKDNQAMRVVSEDNKVYTLSAKLYKEAKAKKFSDFILYTKPLASRGTNDLDLIEQLAERFDNHFVMLDEIFIDLSGIDIPENSKIQFIQNNETTDKKIIFNMNIKDNDLCIKRSHLIKEKISNKEILKFTVTYTLSEGVPETIYEMLEIEVLPLL